MFAGAGTTVSALVDAVVFVVVDASVRTPWTLPVDYCVLVHMSARCVAIAEITLAMFVAPLPQRMFSVKPCD